MGNVEVDARLDLIQMAANVVNGDFESPIGDEDDRLLDLIEELCRNRNLPVGAVLSTPAVEVLRARCGEELNSFAARHGISLPS
ncbi:hypothetical protein EON82_02945 [bacterium]|nr:MAG: hypothetical protein EON82_02945 [bacterium]